MLSKRVGIRSRLSLCDTIKATINNYKTADVNRNESGVFSLSKSKFVWDGKARERETL